MLKVKCGECQFWGEGVRFKKALELCSKKGVYVPKTDSCGKSSHVDPMVRKLTADFSG